MATQNSLPEATDIMEAIVIWWEGLGIKVNRIPFTGTVFTQALTANYQKSWPRPNFQSLLFNGNLKDTSTGTAALQNNSASLYHVDDDPVGLQIK